MDNASFQERQGSQQINGDHLLSPKNCDIKISILFPFLQNQKIEKEEEPMVRNTLRFLNLFLQVSTFQLVAPIGILKVPLYVCKLQKSPLTSYKSILFQTFKLTFHCTVRINENSRPSALNLQKFFFDHQRFFFSHRYQQFLKQNTILSRKIQTGTRCQRKHSINVRLCHFLFYSSFLKVS